MRFLIAFLAMIGASVAFAAAPQRPWDAVVTKAPDGAFVIGNPAAKVKLVEYMSYTCPHCAVFHRDSAAVLRDQMIRSGKVSLELHNMVRDPLDLAAAVLARAGGAARFERVHDAIYAAQDSWLTQGSDYAQANAARLRLFDIADRLKTLADGSGLTAIARANGITDAQIASAFAGKDVDILMKLRQSIPAEVTGTPSFRINGVVDDAHEWSRLQPLLKQAGA